MNQQGYINKRIIVRLVFWLVVAFIAYSLFSLIYIGVVNKREVEEKWIQREVHQIHCYLDSFFKDYGRHPSSLDEKDLGRDLGACISNGFVYGEAKYRPYKYEKTTNGYVIVSAGPDGKFNTSDDVKFYGPIKDDNRQDFILLSNEVNTAKAVTSEPSK